MGAWNNILLLGSALIVTGVAGLLLRRDGLAGLVSLSIGWLGLPVLVCAARVLHPGTATSPAIPVLMAVLAVYLVVGARLRGDDFLETEADDVDHDSAGKDDLADNDHSRDWSTELAASFRRRIVAGPSRPGGDEHLP
jgi:energy-converting hydrogenase Eha subunit C